METDSGIQYVEIEKPATIEKLCEAYRILESRGLMHLISRDGNLWYTAHKKEDEARLKAERAKLDRKRKKEAILSKLTSEEKKVLGLI
jgi:hypothetical protein